MPTAFDVSKDIFDVMDEKLHDDNIEAQEAREMSRTAADLAYPYLSPSLLLPRPQ